MSIIPILTTIISAGELATKAGEVAAKLIPEPPKKLEEKFRWLQCTVKNETQFNLLLIDTFFDSGRYWTAPGGTGSFTQMVYSCCNGDNTVGTGATGGTAFRLSLDDKHYFDISLGWTTPAVGAFKAGVVNSSKGKDGYNAATTNGGSIQSPNIFEGKDKAGNKASFRIHVSAAPGQETLYVIKEVLVSHPAHAA